ncbi:hypothetical protein CALCODRAFT_481519 [Calocera cornea HHB12733]|uniref:DUF6532 domain-containing protein n=1 Tax=Calocera cornea HHB12733 TaxID=1353952 RepID=A0A165HLM2_9BASI|nr:hypothetical protein CALCODRAFT_481519 [Calocera cornea HHB12733]
MSGLTTFRAFYPLLSEPSSTGALRFGEPQHHVTFFTSSISIGPVPAPFPDGGLRSGPVLQSQTGPVAPAQTTTGTADSAPTPPPRTSSGARGWFARQKAAAVPVSTLLAPPPPKSSAVQVKQTAKTRVSDGKKRVSDGNQDYLPESGTEDVEELSDEGYQGSSTRSRKRKPRHAKRSREPEVAIKREPARKKPRRTKTTVSDDATPEAPTTTALSSIHDPPAAIPPEKGGIKLQCFCPELKETIQEAKILFRLQFATINLYAEDNQREEFMATAILLANRSAHARWEKQIAGGDAAAIHGTLQGRNLTLAKPLISHYGPWFRTVIKSVAQTVVKQSFPELFDSHVTDQVRRAEVARLLDANSYLYGEISFDPDTNEMIRSKPFQSPALRAVIMQAWFGNGVEGDGHVFPELFLPEREPDGVITAAAVALLFALKQYETGRFVASEFNQADYQPAYRTLGWNLDWLKRKRRPKYDEILPYLLAVAVKVHDAQTARKVIEVQKDAEDDAQAEEEWLFLETDSE